MKEGLNLSYTVRDQFKVQEGKQISNQCKGNLFFFFFFILFLNVDSQRLQNTKGCKILRIRFLAGRIALT